MFIARAYLKYTLPQASFLNIQLHIKAKLLLPVGIQSIEIWTLQDNILNVSLNFERAG